MIYEQFPLITKFISVPPNLKGLKCEYFNAGLIKGILDSAEFPATIQVLSTEKNWTVYFITFEDKVIKREANLNS
jgi:trafficking protein particle complex subunit 5